MSITIVGGGNPSGPTFPVQRSVRLRSSASAYFNRTPAAASNRQTWTWSAWVKRGTLGVTGMLFSTPYASSGNNSTYIQFAGDILVFASVTSNTDQIALLTSQVFRDPSAWYHIVVVADTTNATSTERARIYINGVRVTAFSVATYPAQNTNTYVNTATVHQLGRLVVDGSSASQYFDGYLTEVNFIDGQALTPASFGAYNSFGVWSPAKYSGSYGTNGFYLNFQDNSGATATTIGKDSSGNGNNWTPNNISVTAGITYDSMLDVPTNTSATNANYCTLNPLSFFATGASASNGNLRLTITTVGGNIRPTMGATSGKYYAEFTITNIGGASGTSFSIQTAAPAIQGSPRIAGIYYMNGQTYNYVTASFASYGASYTTGDVIGVAWDIDNTQVTFYKNNTSQGTLSGAAITPSNATEPVGALAGSAGGTGTATVDVNFGQQPFTYTPPTGFKSLNTFNLSAPTIPNGAAQFAATLYTGNGSTQSLTNTVNGVSFQPDFVWVKGRSGATDHALYDSVRGTTKQLESNTTTAETTEATGLTAFGTAGFTVGALAQMNTNTATYVGWQWKANGTPAVTNTSGTIPSTISANTTSGFSIVTYTGNATSGATVGHSLGVKPAMIIGKNRSGTAQNWQVWHQSMGDNVMQLNLTNAQVASTSNSVFLVSGINSTVFQLGTNASINGSATTQIAYCFSEIAGFSKFGSYTGNNSTDGPFVYCGFRPAFILVKRIDTTGNWSLWDNKRGNPFNVVSGRLYPDSSASEDTSTYVDLLANGFKLRTSGDPISNASGGTYIYAAFAESPFNYSLAR